MEIHAPARIVWHDLFTHDVEAALAFYPAVFGWTSEVVDIGSGAKYRMWRNEGREFGGVVPLGEDADMPAGWLPYASVDDVDAACARAAAAGGRLADPPRDVGGLGRMAVIVDPAGAALALWRGFAEDAPDAPGAFLRSELLAHDAREARDFLQAVVGGSAGIRELPGDDPGLARWITWIPVDDVGAAVRAVGKARGRILPAPAGMPSGSVLVADPAGATFGLVPRHPAD